MTEVIKPSPAELMAARIAVAEALKERDSLFQELCMVIRQAFLMVVGWIELKYGLKRHLE
jgi:hypothetical protein